MTVHFIGAGPGAADLITLRGRDLIAACPVCLYAGSLVPQALLAHCPPGARIVNTAALSLDEIIAEMLERSPMFREFWHESEIIAHLSGTHNLETEVGTITMQHTSYAIEQAPSQRLMLFAPADAASAATLRRVTEALPEPA